MFMTTSTQYSHIPLISVVMPAFNAEKFIKQAIDSMLAQTYPNWELLVADDASTDNTRELVNAYSDPRIKTFHQDQNLGYPLTCNRLLSLATGDYLTFLDSDDYTAPNRLELLYSAFQLDPSLGMVGSAVQLVSEEGILIRTDIKPQSYDEILDAVNSINPFCGAALMVTREVYNTIGGYRDFFLQLRYQDFDWSSRIIEKYKAINLPDPLYYYRQNPASNSKQLDPMHEVALKAVRYLRDQRLTLGKDDLELKNQTVLESKVEDWLIPYRVDTTLVHREAAGKFMYNKMYRQAIQISWKAVRQQPMRIINWRTLAYCVRKSIFASNK